MTEPTTNDLLVELNRQSRELKQIRELVSTFVNHMVDAEKEIPESMRRFVNYYHDIHDVKFVYEELGHSAPNYILRELERCDDRIRQLLTKHYTDGGVFEKVRREMAEDPENRWDHTRLLFAPKEMKDETRQSKQRSNGREKGADPSREEPSGNSSAGDSAADEGGNNGAEKRGRRI